MKIRIFLKSVIAGLASDGVSLESGEYLYLAIQKYSEDRPVW